MTQPVLQIVKGGAAIAAGCVVAMVNEVVVTLEVPMMARADPAEQDLIGFAPYLLLLLAGEVGVHRGRPRV